MKTLSLYYIKTNLVILISCIALAIFNIVGMFQFETVALILLTMLVYNINVNDKIKGNWSFFQSLPMSFSSQYLVKVALPWIFSVLILLGLENRMDLLFFASGDFSEILFTSSLLVLSSILANNLSQFVLYLIGLSLLTIIRNVIPYGDPSFAIIGLLAAAYYLSEKRVSSNKVAIASLLAVIAIQFSFKLTEKPMYQALLNSNSPKATFLAANHLVPMGDNAAITRVKSIIVQSSVHGDFSSALDILEDNDIKLEISQEKWLFLFETHKNSRANIISYFKNESTRPDWISHQSLIPFEDAIFRSDACNYQCKRLADFIADELKSIDKIRIKELITSAQIIKVQYALEILEESKEKGFQQDVINLLSHPLPEIREQAFEYLSNVLENEQEGELEKLEDSLKKENTPENFLKAKEFFERTMGSKE